MDSFQTLAEVAVAIAGFSSLAIVFRGQNADWQGQDFISLGFAMCWSIGSVFFALLPIILGEFGVDLVAASRVGLFCIAAYMLLAGAILTIARRRVELAGGGSAGLSVSLSLLFAVILLCALGAGSGLLPGSSNGWFAAVIALLMAHATAELGLLVVSVVRTRP
jgi:hypothetical protein